MNERAGFDISRSGVSKIEARLSYVDDKTVLYLAGRIHDFMAEAGDDTILIARN
jgi:hypothetical protein